MKPPKINPCFNGCACKNECMLFKDDPLHGEVLLSIFVKKLKAAQIEQRMQRDDERKPATA